MADRKKGRGPSKRGSNRASKNGSKGGAKKSSGRAPRGNAGEHIGGSQSPSESASDDLMQKSEWMSESDSPAGAPLTEDEKNGLDLLGRGNVRDGAIPGVGGGNDETYDDPESRRVEAHPGDAPRRNPPLVPDAGMGDGGISASGGRAGGARGSGGRDSRGAGDPFHEDAGGPAEYKASSRLDLGHPDTDMTPEDREREEL